jgi:poly(ADP-ribose) glycohydrolase
MGYFAEVVCDEGRIGMPRMEWEVVYTLRALSGNMNEEEDVLCEKIGKGSPLGEAEVLVMERYDTSPASLGLPGGAAVVSANRFIGFGQSATQEEVHVGTSPEACPAVLVTPPLKDDQVLIVRGAQAMVNVSGRGRNIVVDEIGVPPGGENGWRERTMLFMDALELDLVQTTEPGLSDLIRENVDREIRKACTAFSAGSFGEVRTGLWGCGAFAGDPGVKMLLLWVAASVAGIRLVAICDQGLRLFAEELQLTLEWAKQELRDTKALRQVLDRAPKCLARGQILTWIRTEYKREQPALE